MLSSVCFSYGQQDNNLSDSLTNSTHDSTFIDVCFIVIDHETHEHLAFNFHKNFKGFPHSNTKHIETEACDTLQIRLYTNEVYSIESIGYFPVVKAFDFSTLKPNENTKEIIVKLKYLASDRGVIINNILYNPKSDTLIQ